ncbi:MAG TPA: TfoX/Sxy family protein [Cyclobacteriaceae bacterium]
MAYNEDLADRVRKRFAELAHVEEKPMIGGLTFMVNGKMCVGVMKDDLMCRIDPALHNESLEKEGCRTVDFIKRPMSGYILIDSKIIKSKKDFEHWIGLALEFNKKAKPSKKRKKK